MKVERYRVGLVQKIHTEIADELPLGPLFSVSITYQPKSVPTNDQAVRFLKMVEGSSPFLFPTASPTNRAFQRFDLIALKRSNKSGYCFPSSLSVTNIATPTD